MSDWIASDQRLTRCDPCSPLIQVVNRCVSDSSVQSVDSSNKLVRGALEFLIFHHVGSRWHGDLHEHHFTAQRRILLEETLERVQLVLDA